MMTDGSALWCNSNNDFLLEKITTATSSKPPNSRSSCQARRPILDNNFFAHAKCWHGIIWRSLLVAVRPPSTVPGRWNLAFSYRKTGRPYGCVWSWWGLEKVQSGARARLLR